MYNYIIAFFSMKKQPSQTPENTVLQSFLAFLPLTRSGRNTSQFGAEYRRGYKRAWIDNIKDYRP